MKVLVSLIFFVSFFSATNSHSRIKICDDLKSDLFLLNLFSDLNGHDDYFNARSYYSRLKTADINQVRCSYPELRSDSPIFEYELTYFDALIQFQAPLLNKQNSYPNYDTYLNNLIYFLIHTKGLKYQKENLFNLYKVKDLNSFKNIWHTSLQSGLKLNQAFSFYNSQKSQYEYTHSPVINALNAFANRDIINYLISLPDFDPTFFDHKYGSVLNWFFKVGHGASFATQILNNPKFKENIYAPGIVFINNKFYYTNYLGVLIYEFSKKAENNRSIWLDWLDGKTESFGNSYKDLELLDVLYTLFENYKISPYTTSGAVEKSDFFAINVESSLSPRQVFYSIFGDCSIFDRRSANNIPTSTILPVPDTKAKSELCRKFYLSSIPIGSYDTKHQI